MTELEHSTVDYVQVPRNDVAGGKESGNRCKKSEKQTKREKNEMSTQRHGEQGSAGRRQALSSMIELVSSRFLLIETANSLDAFIHTTVLDFDSRKLAVELLMELSFPPAHAQTLRSHSFYCAQTTALCLRFLALCDDDVDFVTRCS